MQKNFFLPLGGGDEIGASSYFFCLSGSKILIDAGLRYANEISFPKFEELYRYDLDGLWELDAIFVSHAHLDHIGALPRVHQESQQVPIYATKDTKIRMNRVLQEIVKQKENIHISMGLFEQILVDSLVNAITVVEFYDRICLGSCQITFLPADHIPGAASFVIADGATSLLFTGDFSNSTHYPSCPIDILITETTCGYKDKENPTHAENEKILDLVRYLNPKQVILCHGFPKYGRGKNLLKEIFCLGRGQIQVSQSYNNTPIYF